MPANGPHLNNKNDKTAPVSNILKPSIDRAQMFCAEAEDRHCVPATKPGLQEPCTQSMDHHAF
jgi:hypothetical protein